MSLTKIAVLSNVNMNYVIRMLKKDYEVYDSEGYGNELGIMMNPQSSYHEFNPNITFLIMDLMEVLEHQLEITDEKGTGNGPDKIEQWFAALEACLKPRQIYYISDAYLWGAELKVLGDPDRKRVLEAMWQEKLNALCANYANVYILPYHQLVETLGEENTFSRKMWYMGRILHTNEAQKRLGSLILRKVLLQERTSKKVLLLDLDNTLWGGLAGEAEHTPIELSEEHSGLAYKNLQRVILQMQKQGVILGIVSKNNEADAMEILNHHPHQVLRPECFAVRRINWKPKHENILEIADELNLGLDAFVFWDDNPTERELVSSMLADVTVPGFPEKPEDLALAMTQIYYDYFEKAAISKEDLEKTKQYADNARRKSLQSKVHNYEEYLEQLQIVITREDPYKNMVRLTQLVNKTNQFNLTTKRYDQMQIQQILNNPQKKVFLYRVSDCFGDNGIVAAGIVDIQDTPEMEVLVMSCRVMGKNIEYAILEDIENALQEQGLDRLRTSYVPTARNKPVEMLFETMGYERMQQETDGTKRYEIDLAVRPKRVYYARIKD